MENIPTVEVALYPNHAYCIINACDFDPAKHVLWSEWLGLQPAPVDMDPVEAVDAPPDGSDVGDAVVNLGFGWYSYQGRKLHRKDLPPEVAAKLED